MSTAPRGSCGLPLASSARFVAHQLYLVMGMDGRASSQCRRQAVTRSFGKGNNHMPHVLTRLSRSRHASKPHGTASAQRSGLADALRKTLSWVDEPLITMRRALSP